MKSLRLRIFSYFFLFAVAISVIMAIGTSIFIDDYYYSNKIEQMEKVANNLSKVYAMAESEDEALSVLEMYSYNFEGKISIFDVNSRMLVFKNQRFSYTEGRIIEEIIYGDKLAYVYEIDYPIKGTRTLIFIEQISASKVAMLEIPIGFIEDTTSVVKRFSNMVIIFAGFVALILANFLASGLARPMKELNDLAKHIGTSEFLDRYNGSKYAIQRQDEIGDLGMKLKETSENIVELIADLETELQKERNIELMRRKFIATVSHELQTPMTIILTHIEALEEGIVEEDEILEYYHIIEEESIKVSKMTSDLLQLSQIEAGTLSIKKEKVELDELVRNVYGKFDLVARQMEIDLSYQVEIEKEKGVEVTIDPLRIEQSVMNILQNALKFASSKIIISLTEKEESYILSIYNDGEGINDADLPHLFDSFYKGVTSKKVKGTGLGLSIAAGIFKLHGVSYEVQNLSDGVEFNLNFPKKCERYKL